MTDRLNLSRRDFLNGIALGVAAGGTLSPLEILAAAGPGAPYPPALTGMRGSHPGSFEVAHAVAWQGRRYPRPGTRTDQEYDLVVVGAGLSGLASAWFHRQQSGPGPRILVLDNHDDFGGHARRNEFTVAGKTLIGYGGSQSIDGPASYSPEARQLLQDVGIETDRFYQYFDQDWYGRHGLGRGIYFDAAGFGRDVVAPDVLRAGGDPEAIGAAIAAYPLPEGSRAALLELFTTGEDVRPDLAPAEKVAFLRGISYLDYLTEWRRLPADAAMIFRDTILGLWGVGWDALSALEAWRTGMPGFGGLAVPDPAGDHDHGDEPYIFHFPDGNAGIARAIVRRLIPGAVPGSSMEDLVTARVDYAGLDRRGSDTRIRLDSTAVDVRHAADGQRVDVTYVRGGSVERVRARHVVLACYNRIIPFICPELPERQREAIDYAQKVPLVYLSIAVRNWRAFANLGYGRLYLPNGRLMNSVGLDFPVSMGDYRFTSSPEQPTVLHGGYVPTAPGQGLVAREQHLAGRRRLYQLSFADFEADIVAKLDGALGAAGFDAGRDIAALTVNRWPHGYAYEYNDLSDPAGWGPHNGPHVEGRAQLGRISIANSDASAYAYVDGAVDAAWRAVNEQLAVS